MANINFLENEVGKWENKVLIIQSKRLTKNITNK